MIVQDVVKPAPELDFASKPNLRLVIRVIPANPAFSVRPKSGTFDQRRLFMSTRLGAACLSARAGFRPYRFLVLLKQEVVHDPADRRRAARFHRTWLPQAPAVEALE